MFHLKDQLTAATLNLHGRHDRWLQRRSLIVAEILDNKPDLLSLQEIYRPIGQARWLRNQVNSRLGKSSRRRYRLLQCWKEGVFTGLLEGIGILTRLPVLSHDSISLGHGGRVALRANVELPSGLTLDFVATHFHHIASDREARLEQALRLMAWLHKRNPVAHRIIAGDLNEVPDGPAITHLRQAYRSVFVEKQGYDPLATFPTALVQNPTGWAGCLDYIFISNAIDRVLDARLFCKKAAPDDPGLYPSDHVGLLTTVEIDSKSGNRTG